MLWGHLEMAGAVVEFVYSFSHGLIRCLRQNQTTSAFPVHPKRIEIMVPWVDELRGGESLRKRLALTFSQNANPQPWICVEVLSGVALARGRTRGIMRSCISKKVPKKKDEVEKDLHHLLSFFFKLYYQ